MPYSRSEVIHRAGDESNFPAFERGRPRIVNNFAVKRVAGLRIVMLFRAMNGRRLSNLATRLGLGNEYSDPDESQGWITAAYKDFASNSSGAKLLEYKDPTDARV